MRGVVCVACAWGSSVAAARTARAFVPPPYATVIEPPIEGTYLVSGVEPDGVPEPDEIATITRVGGARYEMTEAAGGVSLSATCLRRGTLFACGWGRPEAMCGVDVFNGSPVAEGEWWISGGGWVGHERLVGGDLDLGGDWTILEGHDASEAGLLYTGSARSTVNGLIQQWTWSIGSTTWYGWGVRFGGALAVGFNLAGTCGVVSYVIRAGGRRLEGVWVDPARATSLGTETLVRS